MKKLLITAYFLQSLNSLYATFPLKDEIDFFNVGQGHAVLINKIPTNTCSYVPLLIDAGSTSHPFEQGENFEYKKPIKHKERTPSKDKGEYNWKEGDASLSSSKITKRILDFWQSSNNGRLQKGLFQLNIIASHPDDDHHNIIPVILSELIAKQELSHFRFQVSFFLGGKKTERSDTFLKKFPIQTVAYTDELLTNKKYGLCLKDSLGFLKTSGCITHLFCPKGIKSDDNRWSIITRIEINGISAILCGDANTMVKQQMLDAMRELSIPLKDITSDILLLPHHGAEKTSHPDWDLAVDPKALVIGAAPHEGYHHPRGDTILSFLTLSEGKGRLWSNKVRQHAVQYYSSIDSHQQILGVFQNHGGRLFDSVPNTSIEQKIIQMNYQWYLAWNDLPLYTLWTTGTLYFSHNIDTPIFAEAPYGLMNYVAVANPVYLFPPYMRTRLTPLNQDEHKLFQQITSSLRKVYEIDQSIDDERNEPSMQIKQNIKLNREAKEKKLREAENIFSQEMLLIDDPNDRRMYLTLLKEIMTQERIIFSYPNLFFLWMREAVTNRNKMIPLNEERLMDVTIFIMTKSLSSYLEKPQGKFAFLGTQNNVWHEVCLLMLHEKAFILRTFLKSTHPIEKLGNYINEYSNCACNVEEINTLCPFGYPEWIQLSKLSSFFYNVIMKDSDVRLTLTDIQDIIGLRMQGKNFKDIAKILIDDFIEFQAEEEARPTQVENLTHQLQKMSLQQSQPDVFKERQKVLLQILESYFPSISDDYLS